jgi:hypothetical protein
MLGKSMTVHPHAATRARLFEHRLERLAQRKIEEFTAANLLAATGRPALLLHSRDDPEVSFDNAPQVVASSNGLAELQSFDGLGHRKMRTPGIFHTGPA